LRLSAARKRGSTTPSLRPRGRPATVDEQDCQQRSAPYLASTAGHPSLHAPEKPAAVVQVNAPLRSCALRMRRTRAYMAAADLHGGGQEEARHRPWVGAAFSTCPPNSNRIAESTRSWNSASPRDAKRSNRAAARTWAGTASSIAAVSVQRPSPESDTLPLKRESVGSPASPDAVRSSSHEATTLPRRQTSAMSARSKSYW